MSNDKLEYCDRYRDGNLCIVVLTGMPEHHVQIGIGESWAEAVAELQSTAIQSTGPDCGRAAALEWAVGAGWISDVDDLEAVDDDDDDDSDGDE